MIGLLGLDYRGTSAELRGRLSFAGDRLHAALRSLVCVEAIQEVVIVSTCNRTEVYVSTENWTVASASITRFLDDAFHRGASAVITSVPARGQQAQAGDNVADTMLEQSQRSSASRALPPDELGKALYELTGAEAARHLFYVAAGLRSMVIGEAQILGQVREALAAAETTQTAGEELRALFTTALKIGKRTRTETEIGRADVSIASLAVRVAGESLGGLRGKSVLLIGAGRTSRLCAQLLCAESIQSLVLANRTAATAHDLAREVSGHTIALADVAGVIPTVDLIISATAAPHTVLAAATVAHGIAGRQAPLVIVDLAVPPDVEDEVGLLPSITLFTLDNLRGLDGAGMVMPPGRRDAELSRAAEIAEEGVRDYVRARTLRLAVPGIAGLRRHVDRSEETELARALAQLDGLSDAHREVIERFGQRLVDKMFHHLVSRIRSLAEYDEVPPEITMRVLARLFADPESGPEDS